MAKASTRVSNPNTPSSIMASWNEPMESAGTLAVAGGRAVGCLQRHKKNAPDRRYYSYYQEWFARQHVRLNRRTYSVQDLDQHQNEEQSFNYGEEAACLRPFDCALP